METQQQTVRLALDVSPEFREKLKICAALQRRPIREIVIESVNAYFQQNVDQIPRFYMSKKST